MVGQKGPQRLIQQKPHPPASLSDAHRHSARPEAIDALVWLFQYFKFCKAEEISKLRMAAEIIVKRHELLLAKNGSTDPLILSQLRPSEYGDACITSRHEKHPSPPEPLSKIILRLYNSHA
jgi:hypothetical protein